LALNIPRLQTKLLGGLEERLGSPFLASEAADGAILGLKITGRTGDDGGGTSGINAGGTGPATGARNLGSEGGTGLCGPFSCNILYPQLIHFCHFISYF
jgi:hypothetical protein